MPYMPYNFRNNNHLHLNEHQSITHVVIFVYFPHHRHRRVGLFIDGRPLNATSTFNRLKYQHKRSLLKTVWLKRPVACYILNTTDRAVGCSRSLLLPPLVISWVNLRSNGDRSWSGHRPRLGFRAKPETRYVGAVIGAVQRLQTPIEKDYKARQ